MKFTFALLAGAVATAAASLTSIPDEIMDDSDFPTFMQFIQDHSKNYVNQAEFLGRFMIFKNNLRLAAERNQKGTEKHGVTKFMDMHPDEFTAKMKGHKARSIPTDAPAKDFNATEIESAKLQSIDWVAKGATTPVKNQGQCGSCWAFSATEQIESDIFLSTGKLHVLAPQQIVSCDTVDLGCNGGNTDTAYEYVMQAGGIEPESDYPYTSGTTETNGVCKFNKADVATDITGYKYVSQSASQERQMYTQLQQSPISICVDATIWQTYQSGIITTSSDCGTQLDHCVQLVGATSASDSSTGKAYYKIRNSWATDWGEQGYIYVEAGHNVCGLALEATVVSPN
eukprot:CAMPEP_0195516828 /NCGR_PEP_ID=MMETSP0794_2-20130614/8852_1 /TAXON_ID=515487 /ORGANISM="Stephanopyxis turris, Strain CCMP 815" /LENGTH=341 /DNA_ID=CAMNT_0040645529 /DNA_START=67 /DNA_END=1092 /DNA_ORIENTATION=-